MKTLPPVSPIPGFWKQQQALAKEPVDIAALFRAISVEPCWRCGAEYDRAAAWGLLKGAK